MKKAVAIGAALAVLALLVAGSPTAADTERSATYQALQQFTEALSIVREQYVDEVPLTTLVATAIKGTLRGLDPYSAYLDPDSYHELETDVSGHFEGVGLETTLRDDALTVVAAIEGTPAERAGIQSGDRIVTIDGVSTADMQPVEAARRVRGAPGTEVTLTLTRTGWSMPRDVRLTREKIRVQSVRTQDLGAGVAYIRVRYFQQETSHDLAMALDKFSRAGLEGAVLDLRDNPGGLVQAAVDVAGQFLENGQLVVYTEGRDADRSLHLSARSSVSYGALPLVVLVNHGSASASEIVAGALQDWRRGIVVGTRTFGKAAVQSIIPLSDGSALQLTTAKYVTPRGRSIQGTGLTPDIVVDGPPPAGERVDPQADRPLQRALDILTVARIIGRHQLAR